MQQVITPYQLQMLVHLLGGAVQMVVFLQNHPIQVLITFTVAQIILVPDKVIQYSWYINLQPLQVVGY